MKQNATYLLKHKTEIVIKTVLANKTNYTLVWYAFYELQPGNRTGPILTAPDNTCEFVNSKFDQQWPT